MKIVRIIIVACGLVIGTLGLLWAKQAYQDSIPTEVVSGEVVRLAQVKYAYDGMTGVLVIDSENDGRLSFYTPQEYWVSAVVGDEVTVSYVAHEYHGLAGSITNLEIKKGELKDE